MSLDWNLRGIANHETLCWVDSGEKREDGKPRMTMNGVTHALIWATIFVDIGHITEKNAAEFYARMMFFTALRGPFMSGDAMPTAADVKAHIGLRTNVADKTTAQFTKRITDLFMREHRKEANVHE